MAIVYSWIDDMRNLCRREFLGTAGAAIGMSCRMRHFATPIPSRVFVFRQPDYTQNLYGQLRRALADFRLNVRGKRVLLKPNLVEFDADCPINTHPVLVHAAYEAFREMGADVVIAEGPGHRRNTLDMAEAAGYFETNPHFERMFTDLNLDRPVEVRLRKPLSKLKSIYLAQSALACDLLVSMPKMKTHHWVGTTLSMKNLFGVVSGGVYGWPKNVLHLAGIPECVADLYHTLPKHFAIVDGIVGMEGNGPIQGTARQAGLVVLGDDLAAVDATCCRIMSIDPHKIDYLSLAVGDVDSLINSTHQMGELPNSLTTPFNLIPEWRHIRQVAG